MQLKKTACPQNSQVHNSSMAEEKAGGREKMMVEEEESKCYLAYSLFIIGKHIFYI